MKGFKTILIELLIIFIFYIFLSKFENISNNKAEANNLLFKTNNLDFIHKDKISNNYIKRKLLDELCESWFRNDSLFSELKIYIDTKNIDDKFENQDLSRYKDLIINSVNEAAKIIESFLEIMEGTLQMISNNTIKSWSIQK